MQSIITSFLIQSNYCALPHIGVFETIYKHAGNDILNVQLIPPAEVINFKQEERLASPEFISFIAFKKNISVHEAESQLNKFCNEWKDKISAGETLYFYTLGALKKDEKGNIVFTRDNSYACFRPIPAVKVSHKDVENSTLVNEDRAGVLTDKYYPGEISKKASWQVLAIIFGAVALCILFYHFYNNKFSTSSIGNQNKVVAKPAPETYSVPSK